MTPFSLKKNLKNVLQIFTSYNDIAIYNKSFKNFPKNENSRKMAIVIHLFYLDNWEFFVNKINVIKEPYDLYITVPYKSKKHYEEILKYFPSANILGVPNRGRDVLPFIMVAKKLHEQRYEYVLKFHSKKSTHRLDGEEWLIDMINSLIPDNNIYLSKIINTIKRKNAGLIGPAGYYYPLTVNFPANGVHITKVLCKIYGKQKTHELVQVNRNQYGFFAGTMFWLRLEAIEPLLKSKISYFENENGQIDATFAHALERLFCIIPEFENKSIYELLNGKIIKRPYESSNVPDWSKDHNK